VPSPLSSLGSPNTGLVDVSMLRKVTANEAKLPSITDVPINNNLRITSPRGLGYASKTPTL